VTTPALGSGRPFATFRPTSGPFRLLAIGLLAAATLPVLAAPSAIEPEDPTDITPSLLMPKAAGDNFDGRTSALYFNDVRSLFDSGTIAFDAASATTSAEPKSENRIQRLINRGLALLGTPYRWGGTTPENGFDCSGLVGYVYRTTLGIELPRISRDMANVGELIRDRDSLQQGDLVFFSRRGGRVDHVGIYLGDGQFLHSPRTGKDVEVTTLASGYWSHRFLKGRRVAPTDIASAERAKTPSDAGMAVAKAVDVGAAEAKSVGTQQ
jgi:cell wall-associated NlpC family hydrolase